MHEKLILVMSMDDKQEIYFSSPTSKPSSSILPTEGHASGG